MDLNKTYQINIISQLTKDHCSFLVVERFNNHASQHFQNYYNKLQLFNQPLCNEWYQDLEYPNIDIGVVVLAQTYNNNNKSWSRGIISSIRKTFQSELYFIDTQRIVDLDNYIELRACPPKLFNLSLPTYNICVNVGLNDNWLQSAIESMIAKNQYGEISFIFIPQSVSSDNTYIGELLVNYSIDNITITLETFIKHIHKKKKLYETINLRQSLFDPLKFNHLQEIFVPKDSTTSFSELENSLELNYSDYYSINDTSFAFVTTTENTNTSFISTMNTSNVSTSSFEKTRNSSALTNSSTKSVNQSTEKNQNTSLNDFDNESTTIKDLVNLNGTSSGDNVNIINVPELKLNSTNNQEIKADISNDKIGVEKSLSNDLKSKDEDFIVSLTTVKNPEKRSGTLVSYMDAELWWSDDE